MARDHADPGVGLSQGVWGRHRRRIVVALAVLLLSVAGVLEFGFEVRVPWLAMVFWMLAVVAIIVACSGLSEVPVERS